MEGKLTFDHFSKNEYEFWYALADFIGVQPLSQWMVFEEG